MNKLLNFTNNFKFLCLLFMFVMMARPAYSIPTTIDEIKQVFGALCADYGLEFCASQPDAVKKTKKPHKFTESEKEILTRLAEQQSRLRLRALELDRREGRSKHCRKIFNVKLASWRNFSRKLKRISIKRKTKTIRSYKKLLLCTQKWMRQLLLNHLQNLIA